ncbi:MAG: hypothetical protein PUP93_28370 [Rhizonema sp. NSF051]|nr:hypothetical protein [Rhizonema sp. NSF051]
MHNLAIEIHNAIAFAIAYIDTFLGRSPGFDSRKRFAINSYCYHVKLLGYVLVIARCGADVFK